MPSMDGGRAGGDNRSAALMTISFRDLETSSALVDCLPKVVPQLNGTGDSPPTDSNGNNLPSFTYGNLKGQARSERMDNTVLGVETESSKAACGGVRGPVRKVSLSDLHIRSHQEDPVAACREIRNILREIRDSLECKSADSARNSTVSVSNHATAAAAPTSKCILQDVRTQPTHQTDVTGHQHRDAHRYGWRHCRLSLPARLQPGRFDGLVDGDVNGVVPSRLGRRRVPANVRFADEVGMNLNTFAMIPPRQVRDDSPTYVPLPRPRAASVNHKRTNSPPPVTGSHDVCRNGSGANGLGKYLVFDDELKCIEDRQKLETKHEQFRLCFNQPFAELDRFRCRLDRQLVCLENVRVDDWTAGAPCHGAASNSLPESAVAHQRSSMTANSVILCSIQTKNTSVDHRDAKVFARCTSDNWRTYADLPAQRVSGLDSLGLGYDRYCFAVRRPVTPDPCSTLPCDQGDEPSAVVEFAVCYETDDCAFWDNNDDANYRIEWFQNVT